MSTKREDGLHVILDALSLLRDKLMGEPSFTPWEDYDEHAISTKDGYGAALAAADDAVTVELERIGSVI